jgi:hypothetical protein
MSEDIGQVVRQTLQDFEKITEEHLKTHGLDTIEKALRKNGFVMIPNVDAYISRIRSELRMSDPSYESARVSDLSLFLNYASNNSNVFSAENGLKKLVEWKQSRLILEGKTEYFFYIFRTMNLDFTQGSLEPVSESELRERYPDADCRYKGQIVSISRPRSRAQFVKYVEGQMVDGWDV